MMKTNLVCLALSVQMLAGLPLLASAASFPDTMNHWASSSIDALANQNILGGYPNGSFRPEGSVTRAEFSTMMVKTLGMNTMTPGYPSFSDVPQGFWAYPAIETVRSSNLVSGYPNGTFMPNRSISRAESMSVLVNAANVPLPNAGQTDQILNQFRDAYLVPTWARPGVAAAVQAGLFANDPSQANQLDPLQPATRAEVAVMLENLLEFRNVAQGQQPQYQQPTTNQQNTNQGGVTMGQTGGQTVLQGHIATVPAETVFTGTVTTPISSELSPVGSPVTLRIDQPLISSDGRVVVPMGSQIIGVVKEVESAGRTGRPAKMDIDFNEVIMPDGQRLTIMGSVATEGGVLEGQSTKGRVFKAAGTTAIGAGLGAALGTAMGPLSGGEVGKGAIYGTAVGAGVGALAAAAMKGKEISIAPGERLEIRLERPITVEVGR